MILPPRQLGGSFFGEDIKLVYFLIAVFGSAGALARFGVSAWMMPRTSMQYPWGTLTVNLVGCFVIGLLLGSGVLDSLRYPNLRFALVTGFLGSFTTFSAFSAETWLMFEGGRVVPAVLYVTLSVVGCLLLTAIGFGLGNVGAR